MERLSTFLVAVIIVVLVILGIAPIAFPASIPEYVYSEERAYSHLDIVRDENGTISTFAHPELYGPGAFNLTISNSLYRAIQLNESVADVRITASYYFDIPNDQEGLIMVTPGADIEIYFGDTALSYTTPHSYYIGRSGAASSYDFLCVVNRTQIAVANASELSFIFEFSSEASSNFTYFVNYAMYLRVDLRYQRAKPVDNSFPSISVMVAGLCAVVILSMELSNENSKLDSVSI